jgi:hypothetical protein
MSLRAAVLALLVLAVGVPDVASAQVADVPDWCGDETTANLPDATSAPRYKWIYAYAADNPDRTALLAKVMQKRAFTWQQNLLDASGGKKTWRYDLGTRCGAGYLDIETVALPSGWQDYNPKAQSRIQKLRDDVRAAVDPATGRRNLVIVADEIGLADDPILGIAEGGTDDRAGLVNDSNRGNRTVIVYGRHDNTNYDPTGTIYHESIHSLGAVNDSAPHSDKTGHATDGYDILAFNGSACPVASPPPGQLDCGGDDYFNPAPAPGSYLATHWNTYDSVFFTALDQYSTQAQTPVAKLAAIGSTLDASTSTDPDGVIVKYEWDVGADGSYESSSTTPTMPVMVTRDGTFKVRVTDEDGLTAISNAVTIPSSVPPGTGGDPVVAGLSLKSTKTTQKLKDAKKKGVLVVAIPAVAGKLRLTLYQGKKKLKSVTVTVTAGKKASKRIKLSSRVAKKYLKKGTYEVRATLGSMSATQKVKLK